MDYIPNTDKDREDMLKTIHVSSVLDLFKDIPDKILLKNKLNISPPMSELGLRKKLIELSKKNKTSFSLFLGAGSYNHFIPSIVNHIISRSEFYTAYTPYQPEISQGILQAIYEYQTMICDLTGLDVSNASLYDGASALAEASIMSINITKRSQIIMSKAIHPDYKKVVKTYMDAHDCEVIEIDLDNGTTSIEKLKQITSDKTAGVLIQNPNFLGCIENLKEIEKITHDNKAILTVCITDPTSLGILKSPGSLNADIVVGEGQSFGNPLNFGGPYLGIIAAKKDYMRHVSGRLVGATKDKDKKRGFLLTLQAREQHIRREKASSSICSNEALCALAATVYLSTIGKEGIKEIGNLCLQKSHYLAEKLKEAGIEIPFNKPFYNEFIIKVSDSNKVNEELLKSNIIGGLDLSEHYPELKDCLLFCVTEMNTKEDMDKVVETIKKCN